MLKIKQRISEATLIIGKKSLRSWIFVFVSFYIKLIWLNCFFLYLQSIHKYVIAIYMVEDCLGIVFDTEEVMKTWLEMLISCQMGGRSIEGIYFYIFPYIFSFSKKTCTTPKVFVISYLLFWPSFIQRNFFERKNFSRLHSKKQSGYWKNWRINLCAFENANFLQLFVLKGSQQIFLLQKKFVKWKQGKITNMI